MKTQGMTAAALLLALVTLGACSREMGIGATDINKHKMTPGPGLSIKSENPDGATWDSTRVNQDVHPRTGKEYVQGTRRGGGQVQAQSVNDPGSPSTAALQPQIAEAVAALDEVTGANALVIDGKGYIGVIVKYGYPDTVMDVPGQSANVGEVSGKLKAKVAEAARRIDPGLKEVFVSAHPDFIDRIDRFPAHTKSGKPLEGYIREFGTIVSRLFPAGSGLPSASVTP
ncbi:YhcN/YlaJ family sporulation lipoprotein [Paenibacillus aurantius]|uniref:YhcN/YlaJ family sporulation lipoprotein n=1 Tax=Paenibacillus aurantius TaxID=2918900 RepID=A0AA96LGM5_9BACL|nr:YhcN/YlaJ family sporulation lipoprotein [Paenibacillus aurantius]WNQ12915.1 YhcN/YlaJ family sporulation lipoprotein [Paenibacillus aurantius]